jgi:hypothetical protein
MKKSYVEESLRQEAERQDALAEKGGLDELPLTRLRRYAKEPSQVYAIRMPVSRLTAIRRLADHRKEQPTALLREWILDRLDREIAGNTGERTHSASLSRLAGRGPTASFAEAKSAAAKKASSPKPAVKPSPRGAAAEKLIAKL